MNKSQAITYLKSLCQDHANTQVFDECVGRLFEVGYFTESDSLGNSRFVESYTEGSLDSHYRKVLNSYS